MSIIITIVIFIVFAAGQHGGCAVNDSSLNGRLRGNTCSDNTIQSRDFDDQYLYIYIHYLLLQGIGLCDFIIIIYANICCFFSWQFLTINTPTWIVFLMVFRYTLLSFHFENRVTTTTTASDAATRPSHCRYVKIRVNYQHR